MPRGNKEVLSFPLHFRFGIGSSAFQTEGALDRDGRTPSIWDSFVRSELLEDRLSKSMSCDAYDRFEDDARILRDINVSDFRLSTSWSRVLDSSSSQINEKGLQFYDRAVDSLLSQGIEPIVTLYHWDLPEALEDTGGWLNRDVASGFGDFSALMARRLGDRVTTWALLNEPWVFTYLGYGAGVHAPGRRGFQSFLQAAHHANLAQGLGLQAMRAERSSLSLGGCFNYSPGHPASDSREHRQATECFSALNNHWFLEPIQFGTYPASVWSEQIMLEMGYRLGDSDIMHQDFDWIGINYYFRQLVTPSVGDTMFMSRSTLNNRYYHARHFTHGHLTDSGWEVWPQGLAEAVGNIHRTYSKPIVITECGCTFEDHVESSGQVNDFKRVAYLKEHLKSLHQAMMKGANVKGFHVWSFLDNLEWTDGFAHRYGLVHVDFETGRRSLKTSARWYSQLATTHVLHL